MGKIGTMKILVCCSAGNNRSVALRMHLISRGHDAISCGLDVNKVETINMLCEWADKVIVVDDIMLLQIFDKYHYKTVSAKIGPDKWGRSFNQELIDLTFEIANNLHL